jgi:hypothetical protein
MKENNGKYNFQFFFTLIRFNKIGNLESQSFFVIELFLFEFVLEINKNKLYLLLISFTLLFFKVEQTT